jgi:hypothetical protein
MMAELRLIGLMLQAELSDDPSRVEILPMR